MPASGGGGGNLLIQRTPAGSAAAESTIVDLSNDNGTSLFFLDAQGYATFQLPLAYGATFQVKTVGGVTHLKVDSSGGIELGLAVGQALSVLDHSSNGVFEVDENGNLHGKTGKALVFDL